jgi:hypothetical protein
MLRTPLRTPSLRRARLLARVAAAAALWTLSGCASVFRRTPPPNYGFSRLFYETRRFLDVDEPSPVFYRERARLEVMGPELDEVLIRLATDGSVDENVRANAITLLADRRSGYAVPVLRRLVLTSNADGVRAASVTGLQRFTADSPQVRTTLRAALGDPSPRVRLGALQGLDVEDADAVRLLLPREDDAQVRVVARQLLALYEARGAPLARDERGTFRTAGADTVARIVFNPVRADPEAGVYQGALWVETGGQLLPLAQDVEVVDGVVPAFFDATRAAVVYEAGRQVYVRDLRSGQTRAVGPGIAPRVIPFSDRFVYVREAPVPRRGAGGAASVDYTVYAASVWGGAPQPLGTLSATLDPSVFRGASPVRRMVVGETREGFVLRGPGVTPFALPGPFEPGPQQ